MQSGRGLWNVLNSNFRVEFNTVLDDAVKYNDRNYKYSLYNYQEDQDESGDSSDDAYKYEDSSEPEHSTKYLAEYNKKWFSGPYGTRRATVIKPVNPGDFSDSNDFLDYYDTCLKKGIKPQFYYEACAPETRKPEKSKSDMSITSSESSDTESICKHRGSCEANRKRQPIKSKSPKKIPSSKSHQTKRNDKKSAKMLPDSPRIGFVKPSSPRRENINTSSRFASPSSPSNIESINISSRLGFEGLTSDPQSRNDKDSSRLGFERLTTDRQIKNDNDSSRLGFERIGTDRQIKNDNASSRLGFDSITTAPQKDNENSSVAIGFENPPTSKKWKYQNYPLVPSQLLGSKKEYPALEEGSESECEEVEKKASLFSKFKLRLRSFFRKKSNGS